SIFVDQHTVKSVSDQGPRVDPVDDRHICLNGLFHSADHQICCKRAGKTFRYDNTVFQVCTPGSHCSYDHSDTGRIQGRSKTDQQDFSSLFSNVDISQNYSHVKKQYQNFCKTYQPGRKETGGNGLITLYTSCRQPGPQIRSICLDAYCIIHSHKTSIEAGHGNQGKEIILSIIQGISPESHCF